MKDPYAKLDISILIYFTDFFIVHSREYQSNWCWFINLKNGVYLSLQMNSSNAHRSAAYSIMKALPVTLRLVYVLIIYSQCKPADTLVTM